MYKKLSEQLIKWIYNQVKEAGAKGCVLGISGGVDSAVVAALCMKAFPDNVLGLHMTCYSAPQDTVDARLIAQHIKLNYKEISLEKVYDCMMEALTTIRTGEESKMPGGESRPTGDAEKLASSNIKPRLRMITLYYYANLYNYLVVGTGNRSELEIGYFTKYGDGGVDILPLGGLVKTQVWELAKHLGIPDEIIRKPPTAGLWAGQTDEGELGFTYKQLDEVLLTGTGDERIVEEVKRRRIISKHKIRMPSIPDIKILDK
ncbi:MAG: NAD+ synthase [Firmicutes bacterium]|nr:NAD+ synthase [Bacillota bacterium]